MNTLQLAKGAGGPHPRTTRMRVALLTDISHLGRGNQHRGRAPFPQGPGKAGRGQWKEGEKWLLLKDVAQGTGDLHEEAC